MDRAFDGTPIIALTAHALDDERAQALADGFDHVVCKTMCPDELLRVIRRVLQGREPSRALLECDTRYVCQARP